jgi:hypothetical protein
MQACSPGAERLTVTGGIGGTCRYLVARVQLNRTDPQAQSTEMPSVAVAITPAAVAVRASPFQRNTAKVRCSPSLSARCPRSWRST